MLGICAKKSWSSSWISLLCFADFAANWQAYSCLRSQNIDFRPSEFHGLDRSSRRLQNWKVKSKNYTYFLAYTIESLPPSVIRNLRNKTFLQFQLLWLLLNQNAKHVRIRNYYCSCCFLKSAISCPTILHWSIYLALGCWRTTSKVQKYLFWEHRAHVKLWNFQFWERITNVRHITRVITNKKRLFSIPEYPRVSQIMLESCQVLPK